MDSTNCEIRLLYIRGTLNISILRLIAFTKIQFCIKYENITNENGNDYKKEKERQKIFNFRKIKKQFCLFNHSKCCLDVPCL